MKPEIVSLNVKGLNEREKRLRLEVFLEIGRRVLFVYKRQNWTIFISR